MSRITRIEKISPKKAAELLKKNQNNRKLRPDWINTLARIMLAGQWMLNGETIIIDSDGKLLDGQHRLHAVVKSGVEIESYVVYGLPPEVFNTINQVKAKSNGDMLRIAGFKYASALAAAAAWMWRWTQIEPGEELHQRRFPTAVEIDRVLQDNPDLVQAADAIGSKTNLGKLLAPSLSIFAYCLCARIDRDHAEKFFSSLANGEGLKKPQAVYTLREKLRDVRIDQARLRGHDIIALVFKGWNSSRNGNVLRSLRLPTQGESYPVPK